MLTEGLIQQLANEMYAVALTMKPEEDWSFELRRNDLFLVLIHRYGLQKDDFSRSEWPNDDWPSMYGYSNEEALKLAFEALCDDGRLQCVDGGTFVVTKNKRAGRIARATWPFPLSSAPPAPPDSAPAAPPEAAPPQPA